MHMRKFLKLMHTLGAIGLTGGVGVYLMLIASPPGAESLAALDALRQDIAFISAWLIVPSMAVVLASGLLAMAVHSPFHDAPWVWIKALSGILIFEAVLASVDGPAQRAAEASAAALAGEIDPAELSTRIHDHPIALWVILGLAVGNVAFGIWRPRYRRMLEQRPAADTARP